MKIDCEFNVEEILLIDKLFGVLGEDDDDGQFSTDLYRAFTNPAIRKLSMAVNDQAEKLREEMRPEGPFQVALTSVEMNVLLEKGEVTVALVRTVSGSKIGDVCYTVSHKMAGRIMCVRTGNGLVRVKALEETA